MPLGNLFHRRSQKNKKKKNDTNDDSGTDSDTIPPPKIEVLDENAVLEILSTPKVYNLKTDVTPPTPRNSTCEELLKLNLPAPTVSASGACDEVDQPPEETDHPANDRRPKQRRSHSESGFEIKLNLTLGEGSKRKYGSVGDIFADSGIAISPEDKQRVDEAIGRYVDNLVRDSLVKAVSNVDVDGLCQELVKGLTSRSGSENSEAADPGHLSVELDREANVVSSSRGNDGGVSIDADESGDSAFLGGYLADFEESASVDDVRSVDEDSSICSISDGLKQHSASRGSEDSGRGVSSQAEDGPTQVTSQERCPDELGRRQQADAEAVNDMDDELKDAGSSNPTKLNPVVLIEPPSDDTNASPANIEQGQVESSSRSALCQNSGEPNAIGLPTVTEQSSVENERTSNIPDSELLPASEGSLKDSEQKLLPAAGTDKPKMKFPSTESSDDLIAMSEECESMPECLSDSAQDGNPPQDIGENLPQQIPEEEDRKVSWKVGYLHVKLPAKSRGKAHLKAWKKRCVAIQPDEFVNDPKNPSVVVSVYGASSKHKATFWQTVSGQKAVVYRSSSHTHRYAFTVSEDGKAVIHLAADSESATQEWMAAVRAVLWPPSPFMQLEKMMSGREFEISMIDNEFSYHAGLLGMYGYLTITPKKLILLHPQEGYVIQEWYLNTVDKFQLVPQPKVEDAHKVLAMTTCSDSSTGRGEILLFCNEAVTFLQCLASTIHEVLSSHSKQEGGKYQKELEEIAEWLVSPTQDSLQDSKAEEHYKVPPRQVKSLLDIPNFVFNKPLSPVASAIYPSPPNIEVLEPLENTKSKQTTTSRDSGISTGNYGDDFLNCSTTSFVVGGGPMTGKSSDSELSDTYTPPLTPELIKKKPAETPKAGSLLS